MIVSLFCYSQTDNIMLNSGEDLDVKITEIGADNVKYKKIDFLEGPNFKFSTTSFRCS